MLGLTVLYLYISVVAYCSVRRTYNADTPFGNISEGGYLSLPPLVNSLIISFATCRKRILRTACPNNWHYWHNCASDHRGAHSKIGSGRVHRHNHLLCASCLDPLMRTLYIYLLGTFCHDGSSPALDSARCRSPTLRDTSDGLARRAAAGPPEPPTETILRIPAAAAGLCLWERLLKLKTGPWGRRVSRCRRPCLPLGFRRRR